MNNMNNNTQQLQCNTNQVSPHKLICRLSHKCLLWPTGFVQSTICWYRNYSRRFFVSFI